MSNRRKRLYALLLVAGLQCLGLALGPAHAQSAARSSFDHFTTSWPLEGAHRNTDCERCHVAGIFKGTPLQCSACHSRGGLIRADGAPNDHIRSTQQCQDCHTQASWAAVRRVDHTQVLGSCSSCHNGTIATGKTSDHPPASNQCELCHRTTTWELGSSFAPSSPGAGRPGRTTLPPRPSGSGGRSGPEGR